MTKSAKDEITGNRQPTQQQQRRGKSLIREKAKAMPQTNVTDVRFYTVIKKVDDH